MEHPLYEVKRLTCELTGRHPDTVSGRTPLSSLKLTDLAAVVIACERKYHITVQDDALIDLATLGDLSSYIEERLADGREDAVPVSTDQDRDAWYYEGRPSQK